MSHDAIFSDEQAGALACVLDEIIPPDGGAGLPGAGQLGLVSAIEAAIEKTPDLAPAVEQGLAALAALSAERGVAGFADLPREKRLELLNQIATTQPAFLPGLIFHGYVGYYQHPEVVEALGLEARPPPPKGYEMAPTDWSLLDGVRRSERRYRSC